MAARVSSGTPEWRPMAGPGSTDAGAPAKAPAPARLCRVDGDDAAMRVLRSHDAHVQLAGEGRLHGEASLAAHERRILEPWQGTPDMLHGIRAAAARTALTMFS